MFPGNFQTRNHGSFIQFYNLERPECFEADSLGWKIHLSVSHNDVGKALNILTDIYKRFGAGTFKVVKPGELAKFSDPNYHQAGKIFTLYDTGETNWLGILREIERRFFLENIARGPVVKSDKLAQGSHYIYYRNDLDPNISPNANIMARYVSAKEALYRNPQQPYNPFGLPDPFKGINFAQEHSSHRITRPQRTYSSLSAEKEAIDLIRSKNWQTFFNIKYAGHIERLDLNEIRDNELDILKEALKTIGITHFSTVRSKTFGGLWLQIDSTRGAEGVRQFHKFLNIIGKQPLKDHEIQGILRHKKTPNARLPSAHCKL